MFKLTILKDTSGTEIRKVVHINEADIEAARNATYETLSSRADAGWYAHAAYSGNRFDNKLHASDCALYDARGKEWFGEIFADTVTGREKEPDETCPGEGFVPVTYRVFDDAAKLWLPPFGLYLPIRDERTHCGYRFFKQVELNDGRILHTLIPEKVVPFEDRAEAERTFSEFDLPVVEISGHYRLDDYTNEKRFVGRDFGPSRADGGRFIVFANRRPDNLGNGWVGVRPRYTEPEVVEEATV